MPILSPIPILGLVHRCTIVRSSGDADDGAGGIVSSGEVVIYSNRRCRNTKNTGAQVQHREGMTAEQQWQVLLQYSPNVLEDDIYRCNLPNQVLPIGDYRIIKVKHQIDEGGRFHHTSLLLGATV